MRPYWRASEPREWDKWCWCLMTWVKIWHRSHRTWESHHQNPSLSFQFSWSQHRVFYEVTNDQMQVNMLHRETALPKWSLNVKLWNIWKKKLHTWGLNAEVLGSLQSSKESRDFLFILYVGICSTDHGKYLFSSPIILHQSQGVDRVGLKPIIRLEVQTFREVKWILHYWFVIDQGQKKIFPQKNRDPRTTVASRSHPMHSLKLCYTKVVGGHSGYPGGDAQEKNISSNSQLLVSAHECLSFQTIFTSPV